MYTKGTYCVLVIYALKPQVLYSLIINFALNKKVF